MKPHAYTGFLYHGTILITIQTFMTVYSCISFRKLQTVLWHAYDGKS